jgi:tetratricopeptide (TPR) repeat protein
MFWGPTRATPVRCSIWGYLPSSAATWTICLLRQAATITPSDPLLQNNLGNALRSQGDHVQAISAYRAAVASDDGYVNALYNLAGLLQEQDEGVESEACYRRVVALAPTDVGAWMELGITLLEQGRDDDALLCFERAVALRPEDSTCQYNLGNALKAAISVWYYRPTAMLTRRKPNSGRLCAIGRTTPLLV